MATISSCPDSDKIPVRLRKEVHMASRSSSVSERILRFVKKDPGCLLNDLLVACPEFTWNQIFWEVDHMSRNGQIRLEQTASGEYALRLPSV